MKPIVRYDASKGVRITVNCCAEVRPIDHPSEQVSNTCNVITSRVISYNKDTGEFETRNTRYIPDTKGE